MPKSTHDAQAHWIETAITSAGLQADMVGETRSLWFRNPTNRNSLRLTLAGYNWFVRRSKIPAHAITLVDPVNGKQLLQLERVFTAPYHLADHKTIYVFSETDAVMLQLHSGNLNKYLDDLDT